MSKSNNVSKFKWNVRKGNAAFEMVKADGFQYWDGWVWTITKPNESPAVRVCPFSDYLDRFN